MKRLLLDTHVWVWCHGEPSRLGRKARSLLAKADELWLSPISIWEFLMLVERGRIDLGEVDASQWIALALDRSPVKEAPVDREVALWSRRIGLDHQDPADRFIAATALIHSLTLLTADERLLAGAGYRSVDARR